MAGGIEMAFVAVSAIDISSNVYSKSYERIGMKFYGGVLGSTVKNWLNFGGDPGFLRWVNEQKTK